VSLQEICQWLESSMVGTIVRESIWGFPIIVAVHILGLTLSVGVIIWFDLRLLGATMSRCRVSEVYRRLAPWAFAGFALMFISGGLLLSGFATAAANNLYFRIKLVALLLAAVNILVYHLHTERRMAEWDDARRPALAARMAGLISVVLWITVIMAGRMMSYTMF
jgi:hypothetical protein